MFYNSTNPFNNTLTDHLGSIAVITDEQGSIVTIADELGNIEQEQRYDPWGQYRNSITGEPEETPQLTMLFRGYTGHVQRNTVFESEANQKQIVEQIPMTKEIGKMLPEFGLINMFSEDNSFVNHSATKLFVELIPTESGNGRLYDPVIARVLSPDNYVQNPYNPQNYNRYSYCYNNPLVYVDPDGNNPMYLALGIFVVGSMLDNVLNYKRYEHENIWAAAKAGARQGYNAYNQILSVTSVSVYEDDNWDVRVGLSLVGIGATGGVSYKTGDWTFGTNVGLQSGLNIETNTLDWVPHAGGGIGYYNPDLQIGATIGATAWGGQHSQANWLVRLRYDEWTATMTNDYRISDGDRWRTAAAEIGYNDFAFGFNVYTTEHSRTYDNKWESRLWGPHREGLGAYTEGSRLQSPLYFGYRQFGTIHRIGIDSPWIQDLTQNWKHRNMKQSAYFETDYYTPAKLYLHYGHYNPYALY